MKDESDDAGNEGDDEDDDTWLDRLRMQMIEYVVDILCLDSDVTHIDLRIEMSATRIQRQLTQQIDKYGPGGKDCSIFTEQCGVEGGERVLSKQ